MQPLQSRIDDKSRRFLQAVEYYGGSASTTEIRQRTGLSRDDVNYRFGKLEDLDLIEITRGEKRHPNQPAPKVANLTGTARREIERGLLGEEEPEETGGRTGGADAKAVGEEEVQELWQTIEELERRVNVLTRAGDVTVGEDGEPVSAEAAERIEELEQRVKELEAPGGGSTDVAQAPAVKGLDRRLHAVEEDLDSLESYVFDWTETAQTYLLAIRRVLEDKLDVNMRSHLDAVAAEKQGDGADGGADHGQLD